MIEPCFTVTVTVVDVFLAVWKKTPTLMKLLLATVNEMAQLLSELKLESRGSDYDCSQFNLRATDQNMTYDLLARYCNADGCRREAVIQLILGDFCSIYACEKCKRL